MKNVNNLTKSETTFIIQSMEKIRTFKAIDEGDIETARKDEDFNNLVSLILNLFNKHNKSLNHSEAENITMLLLQKSSTKQSQKTDETDACVKNSISQINSFALKYRKSNL